MEKLTDEQFHKIWSKLQKQNKGITETDWDWCAKQICAYTGGKGVRSELITIFDRNQEETHMLHVAIIQGVTHEITNEQLCDIFDMGNHCTSVGAISYEIGQDGEPLAYLHWSNLGHI